MKKAVDRDIKKLTSYYNKQLKKCHENSIKAHDNNLDYFINYLRYLRDYFLLTEDTTIENVRNLKLTSIVAAVGEYDRYNTCILDYYKLEGEKMVQISDEDADDVAEKY